MRVVSQKKTLLLTLEISSVELEVLHAALRQRKVSLAKGDLVSSDEVNKIANDLEFDLNILKRAYA